MRRRTIRELDRLISKRVLVDPLVTATLFGAYLQAIRLIGLDNHAALLAANLAAFTAVVAARVKWQQLDDGFTEYYFGSAGDE